MGYALLGAMVGAMLVTLGSVEAKGKRPAKGFWKILVKPNAKWVLVEDTSDAKERGRHVITAETYDVHKVGNADVARIRWTSTYDGKKVDDLGNLITHVAVTKKGLYFLDDKDDDAKISKILKAKKPSRTDPPKPYKGTKRNKGRYQDVRNGQVCIGQGPMPDAGPCDDVCEGEMCIDPVDGIVELSGTWAPNYSTFKQK